MKYILALVAIVTAQDEDRICTADSECLVDEVCGTLTWVSSNVDHLDYDADLDAEIQAASPYSACALTVDCLAD